MDPQSYLEKKIFLFEQEE